MPMEPTAPAAEFLYQAANLVSPDIALPGVLFASLASLGLCVWVLTWPAALRRAGKKRAAGASTSVPTEPGPVILTGTVEVASGADVAVRLDITQEGTEAEQSGNWTQTWREKDRKITVAPFELVTESGQRVRVEPTRNVTFVDEFTKKVLINRTTRVRTAELEPGERVWIFGELVVEQDTSKPEGYRGSGTVLVLKDSAKHRMWISSEPLDAPHEREAHWWFVFGLGMLAYALILQGSFVPFYLRAFAGQTQDAVVIDRRVVDGGDSADEYLVDVRLPNNVVASVEVEKEYHHAFVKGMPMTVRRVRGTSWFAQPGPEASLDWLHLGFGIAVVFGAAMVVTIMRWSQWDKPGNKLVEHEDGRLGAG